MNWRILAVFASLAVLPLGASAQQTVAIGNISQVEDGRPATWAISGFEIIRFRQADGQFSPYERGFVCDARLVEILSRTQEPPLRPSDIRAINRNGHHFVLVRRYLLTEVKPQDARAAGTSLASLANQWASSARRALPQIAPFPSRFGI